MRFVAATVLAMALTSSAWSAPVILDTDLGDDIDDTWALGMLLGRPEMEVKLIVTASGDTPTKTRLVAKILDRVGRKEIPIGTGVKTNEEPLNQAKWLGDYQLSSYKGTVKEDGVGAMIDAIRASPGPVTLIVLGPQTNLKAALERAPDIAKNARVVAMEGSVNIGYNGKPGRQPEWNVFRDVAAARAVFNAPWEIMIAPLDLCGQLVLSGEHYKWVEKSTSARAKVVLENYRDWKNRDKYPADASSVLFDAAAVYLAAEQTLCTIQMINLSIDDAGNTVPDEKGRPVKCGLSWKDRDAFEIFLTKALTAHPNQNLDY